MKSGNSSITCKLAGGLAAAVLFASCSLEPPLKTLPDTQVQITGAGVSLQVHSLTGRLSGLQLEGNRFDLLKPWPELDLSADFSVEIEDELTGRIWSDATDSVLVREFIRNENSVTIQRYFEPEGYRLDQEIYGNREGVQLRYRAIPQQEEAPLRSVSFTFRLPVRSGLTVWAPDGDP
ncbi:MAG TPA: hypothetical protein VJ417_12990, partial [Candidatus Glassbacteria bacterium]|nr:hypothetical protein [Candidatus Glassbacteria bacterium]